MALDVTTIEALTHDYIDPVLYDQVLLGNVLLYRQMDKSKKYDGGKKIRALLDYGNRKGGAFNALSTTDTNKYEFATAAYFEVGYYEEPVVVDIDDFALNSGKQQIVDTIESRVMKAPKLMREGMAYDLYNNSTYGATGRGILGLPAICSTTSEYGEVDPDDMSEWICGLNDSTSEPLTVGLIRDQMIAQQVGDGMEGQVSLITTTRTLFGFVKSQLIPGQIYEDAKMADVGFKNVYVEGVPVVSDYYCPSGYMYAFNENYIGFYTHTKYNFRRTKWREKVDQIEKMICNFIWVGQYCCTRRKAQGRHYNLTT
jgi:hypothetical protein